MLYDAKYILCVFFVTLNFILLQLDFIAAEVAYVAEGFTAIVYVIASLVSLLVLIIVLPSLLLGVRVAISGAAIIFAAIVLSLVSRVYRY